MSTVVDTSSSKKRPANESADETIPNGVASPYGSATSGTQSPASRHNSSSSYQSPMRHHHRAQSHQRRQVKETLNARSEYSNSEDDGTAQHRINQYIIGQEIGRGSFGAVHLATDQYGQEYAVKEFSKSRLRKRAQSHLLRRPSRFRSSHVAAGQGFNSPLHRQPSGQASEDNALHLIREEIAIMKKLNHPNVVNLIEVLDDPEEDSLYMVLEMCKKGVVMKVGLEAGRADPYDEETCRCYFRDMLLGIEYLHAQGIIHRDIKPDNCLVTADDILKIVDFGVSEMFEKDTPMNIAKSAGSPAFMPPELCVAKHGQVSGRKADIWSMGVTLYCLRVGQIPFEKTSILDLYESIRVDELAVPSDVESSFHNLITRMLEKDPQQRIAMDQIREHPWVTKDGADPLLSKEENTADLIEPPTEEELEAAITGNLSRLLVVMRAVKRFKHALFRRKPELMKSIFGGSSQIVQPPLSMNPSATSSRKQSVAPSSTTASTTPTTRSPHTSADLEQLPQAISSVSIDTKLAQAKAESAPDLPMQGVGSPTMSPLSPVTSADGRKGQAHDPLQDTLYLRIGTGAPDTEATTGQAFDTNAPIIVSESPSAADGNVYEMAYQEEIERIVRERAERRNRAQTLYLTRRVDDIKHIRETVHAVVEDAFREHKDRFNDKWAEGRERFGGRRERVGEIWQSEGGRGLVGHGKDSLSRVVTRAKDEARRQVEESRDKRTVDGRENAEESLVAKLRRSVEDVVIASSSEDRKKNEEVRSENEAARADAGSASGENMQVEGQG